MKGHWHTTYLSGQLSKGFKKSFNSFLKNLDIEVYPECLRPFVFSCLGTRSLGVKKSYFLLVLTKKNNLSTTVRSRDHGQDVHVIVLTFIDEESAQDRFTAKHNQLYKKQSKGNTEKRKSIRKSTIYRAL